MKTKKTKKQYRPYKIGQTVWYTNKKGRYEAIILEETEIGYIFQDVYTKMEFEVTPLEKAPNEDQIH